MLNKWLSDTYFSRNFRLLDLKKTISNHFKRENILAKQSNMNHEIFQKHMNEENLRAHLMELEAKGMNTRGTLRRLLQQYCREGNLNSAREIAAKCQKEGVS